MSIGDWARTQLPNPYTNVEHLSPLFYSSYPCISLVIRSFALLFLCTYSVLGAEETVVQQGDGFPDIAILKLAGNIAFKQ